MARRHFFCHYFKLHIPFEVTFLLYLPLGIKRILFGKGMNEKGQVPNTQLKVCSGFILSYDR